MIWNTAAWALSTWPWMNGTPGGRERWSERSACCACKSVALEMRQKGSLNAIQVPNGSKRLLGNSNTRFYFWMKYFQRSGSCFSVLPLFSSTALLQPQKFIQRHIGNHFGHARAIRFKNQGSARIGIVTIRLIEFTLMRKQYGIAVGGWWSDRAIAQT